MEVRLKCFAFILCCCGLLNMFLLIYFLNSSRIPFEAYCVWKQKSVPKVIYFLEASNVSDVTYQTMCSIESACRQHPNWTVKFYSESLMSKSSKLYHLQKQFPNLKILTYSISSVFDNTSMEKWFASNTLELSPYRNMHLGDALRITILWKHGGIYLDNDIFVLRPLDSLCNSIGLQNPSELNGAVLVFEPYHPFLKESMEEFIRTYDKDSLFNHGPSLLTRVMQKQCRSDNWFSYIFRTTCLHGFNVNVQPPHVFYPVSWRQWEKFFDPNYEFERLWNDSYVVHLWNHLSSNISSKIGSTIKVPFNKAQQKYCPLTHNFKSKNVLL